MSKRQNMQHIQFKQSHERILLSLAQYKYLTVSQLTKLGVMSNKRNVSSKVKELRDRGFINSIVYGFVPKYGKIENVNYLTPKGKNVLIDGLGLEEDEIRIPIGRSNHFFKDYYHRRNTIDFHIQLVQSSEALNYDVLFFDTYFDKLGDNRKNQNLRAKTRVSLEEGYIIPDASTMIEFEDKSNYLFLVEVYMGKDTLRTIKQLKKHVVACALGTVNEKYDFKRAYRILSVFEHESIKQSVMSRMASDDYFMYMSNHFYFKTLEEVQERHFMQNWYNFKGEQKSIV